MNSRIHPAPPRAPRPDLAALRQNYSDAGLEESDLAPDWVTQFRRGSTTRSRPASPNPTRWCSPPPSRKGRSPPERAGQGRRRGRRRLLHELRSAKSRDLEANPHAAVTFPGTGCTGRSIPGTVARVDAATKPRTGRPAPGARRSVLGPARSPPSCRIGPRSNGCRRGRAAVRRRRRSGRAPPVPVPPHWGGWRITPETVEFWQGRTARLHDRLRYRRVSESPIQPAGGWVVERLAP